MFHASAEGGTGSQPRALRMRWACSLSGACTATEAMSYGCPVVASKTGGLAEIVQHRRNGLLCTPGNAADVAEKVLTLLENDDLSRRLGHQACLDCDLRFRPQNVVRATLSFYDEVVQRFSSRRRTRAANWTDKR